MTWTNVGLVIALLIAAGKFIDSYHRSSSTQSRLVDLIRSALVTLFVALDDIRPIQIARIALRVPIWLQTLVILMSALLLFVAGVTLISLVVVLGKQPYPSEVLFGVMGFALLLQILVFVGFRLLAKFANDIVATFALVAMPATLSIAIAVPISAAADHPGLSGLWLAIFLVFTLLSGTVPIFVVILCAIFTMLLKYCTLAIRWLLMHAVDAASNPKVSPFAYVSALCSLLLLTVKAIDAILDS